MGDAPLCILGNTVVVRMERARYVGEFGGSERRRLSPERFVGGESEVRIDAELEELGCNVSCGRDL